MDLQRARDGAGDVIPADVDDAFARVGEGGEGVWEEVEVVRTATRALVDDHDGDFLAVGAGDGDAAAALGGVGPVGVAQGRAVEVGGEGVCLRLGSEFSVWSPVRVLGVFVGKLTAKLHAPPLTLPP